MSILTQMFNAGNNPPELNAKSLAGSLLRYTPMGTAPLFALTGQAKDRRAVSTTHGYFAKTMSFSKVVLSAAALAAVTSLDVVSAAGIVPGQVIYFPATGENVRVESVTGLTVEVRRGFGRVTADDLADAAEGVVIGSAYEQGSARPTPRSVQAVYVSNFTQIWRNAWALTDTARATASEQGYSNIAESQRDCGYFHAADMEASLFFGQASMGVAANGQPLHSTQGIIDSVREHAPQNVTGFTQAVSYDDLVDAMLPAFSHSSDMGNPNLRIAYCDQTAMRALQQMGKEYSDVTMTPRETSFGQSFSEFTFWKGRVMVQEHPLFTEMGIDEGLMVLVDVPAIGIAYMDGRKQKREDFVPGGSYGGGMSGTAGGSNDGADAQGGSITSEGAVENLNPSGCAVVTGFTEVAPKVQYTKEVV